MKHRSTAGVVALAALVMAAPMMAQTPVGSACSLPANSFGGSGIPTDNSFCSVLDGVTLGLSATPRYTSPALSTDGAGTFSAGTGISTGAPVNAGFAAWNFDFAVTGGTGHYFTLFVDLDPSAGVDFTNSTFKFTGDNQDSSNLGYLSPFDPNADGQYSIRLEEFNNADRGQVLQEAEIEVVVGKGAGLTATPEPATLGLFATGFVGLAGFARRRRARSVA